MMRPLMTIGTTDIFLDYRDHPDSGLVVIHARLDNGGAMDVKLPLKAIVETVLKQWPDCVPKSYCRRRLREEWIGAHPFRYDFFGLPQHLI